MVARFAGKLTQLDKVARVEARRHVAVDGAVDYDLIAKEGDKTIQKELINRFIGTEVDPHRSAGTDLAITPDNYKFKFKGTREESGRSVDVFELHPRKKRVGLFKGEVWMDTPSKDLTRSSTSVFVLVVIGGCSSILTEDEEALVSSGTASEPAAPRCFRISSRRLRFCSRA